MKNLKQLVLLFMLTGLTFSLSAAPISGPATPISSEETVLSAEEMLAQLDRSVLEEKLGRKLRLGERIVLKIMKKKLKKKIKKGGKTQGVVGLISLIFSSVGFLFLILGFVVPGLFLVGGAFCLIGLILGIIGGKDKEDKFAKIGFALGLSGFILGVILVGFAYLFSLSWTII